jgi:hypothetical protein
LYSFIFVVPCIVILCWRNPTRCNSMHIFIYCYIKCFGRPSRPSSGVHKTSCSLWYISYCLGNKLLQTWPNKESLFSHIWGSLLPR